MIRRTLTSACTACALTAALLSAAPARAQIGYGVNAAGTLFSFNVDNTPTVTTHGPVGAVGFVPEGIDFRPGTATLYAIDIGPNESRLYTINITTGASTPVGPAFTSAGIVNGNAYNLTGNTEFGFDVNPTTLQADSSMRIRLVGTNDTNLRLNSSTGAIAAVDGNLAFASGATPFVEAAAYINNTPTMGVGTTELYDMTRRSNALLIQNPPNNGTVTSVGSFGASITALPGIHFDIFTPVGSVDPSNNDDRGLAVYKRANAPVNGPLGAYLLYEVNLDTGETTMGRLVGPAATPFDFEGGFAVLPVVPEPCCALLTVFACAAIWRRGKRRP